MNNIKNSFIKVLFILYLFFLSPLLLVQQLNRSIDSIPLVSSSQSQASNYSIYQSVKYEVEINFSLTHFMGPGNYMFKFSRLNNRIPNSTLTRDTPPYQESALVFNQITGCKSSNIIQGHYDKFNNTYDLFNTSFFIDAFSKQVVSFNQKYSIILNDIRFQNIEESEIGIYEKSDEIFSLYCNHSEPYYERDDPLLIELSNNIVDSNDNPVVKAEKICNWISDNIEYNGNLPAQEKGALWAYTHLEGDCSEYSSLMVTLLRIQGIPARKVTGFLVSFDSDIRPKSGNTWNYYANKLASNILTHAWVEYYVPNSGWIACDPTWNSDKDYFNRIDFLRFATNVGANFFFPPSSIVSEFSNPTFSYNIGADYKFEYLIKITVIESNLQSQEIGAFIFAITIGTTLGICLIIWIGLKIKKKHKRNSF
ncbi:MAG: transglutaminase family protein [Candidatus Hermodarchaeota archaeon]